MSPIGLVLIVLAFLFVWLVVLRPQRRRASEQLQMWDALSIGDEIVTAGGIYGEITGVDGDDLLVRIAPELEVRVARRAIAGVVGPGEEEGELLDDEDDPGEIPANPAAGSYSEEPR